MDNDSYKIIITISHHRISFNYWLRDGAKKLEPMLGGNWPVPLAIYCSGHGFVIGEEAVSAARLGAAGACDDYFASISTDGIYTIGGINVQFDSCWLMHPNICLTSFSTRHCMVG